MALPCELCLCDGEHVVPESGCPFFLGLILSCPAERRPPLTPLLLYTALRAPCPSSSPLLPTGSHRARCLCLPVDLLTTPALPKDSPLLYKHIRMTERYRPQSWGEAAQSYLCTPGGEELVWGMRPWASVSHTDSHGSHGSRLTCQGRHAEHRTLWQVSFAG